MNVPDKQSADGLGDQELYELATAVSCRARVGTGTRQTGALWPVIDRDPCCRSSELVWTISDEGA